MNLYQIHPDPQPWWTLILGGTILSTFFQKLFSQSKLGVFRGCLNIWSSPIDAHGYSEIWLYFTMQKMSQKNTLFVVFSNLKKLDIFNPPPFQIKKGYKHPLRSRIKLVSYHYLGLLRFAGMAELVAATLTPSQGNVGWGYLNMKNLCKTTTICP